MVAEIIGWNWKRFSVDFVCSNCREFFSSVMNGLGNTWVKVPDTHVCVEEEKKQNDK